MYKRQAPIPPGRVSVSNDTTDMLSVLKGEADFVTPSFRTEIIPLIRSLYKVNPDVGIAVQDMFKLGNTKHFIEFPHNTPEEALKMRKHLHDVSKDVYKRQGYPYTIYYIKPANQA